MIWVGFRPAVGTGVPVFLSRLSVVWLVVFGALNCYAAETEKAPSMSRQRPQNNGSQPAGTGTSEAAPPTSSKPPSDGRLPLIIGTVLSAYGAAQMGLAAACHTGVLDDYVSRGTCVGFQLVYGGVFCLAGLSIVATGIVKRRQFKKRRAGNAFSLFPLVTVPERRRVDFSIRYFF